MVSSLYKLLNSWLIVGSGHCFMIFSIISWAPVYIVLYDINPIKTELLFSKKDSCVASLFESIDMCASLMWVFNISLHLIAKMQDSLFVLSWTMSKSIS